MAESKEAIFPEDYYIIDRDDMKSLIQGFPNQIKLAYNQEIKVEIKKPIKQILIAGMGGSAIAGDLLKNYVQETSEIPITIIRSYKIPEYINNEETLVIISSYSGNTEETLSAYKDVLRRKCQTIIMTSGGKLSELGTINRTQIIRMPRGIQPRAALAYSFFPLLKVVELTGAIKNQKPEVDRLTKSLDKKIFKETGINISEKLIGKIPLIYSSQTLESVGYRWKTQLNENSKIMAFNNVFSELNHNEIAAIRNLEANFHCIMLRTDLDGYRIIKRIEITKEYLKKAGIDVTEIVIKGDTLLTKIFSAIHMGDWTSYFLALRYKTDPSPVDIIESFKKDLGTYIS